VTEVVDIPATLAAFGASPRTATATVIVQSPGRRLARTLAGLGSCWAVALATLFIPVAHFILVPTFLSAGIVVAMIRAREDRRLLKVVGVCPRCGVSQEFSAGGRFQSEKSLDCPKCHNRLTLSDAAPATAEVNPS
jgi:hypothetical protein